MRIRKVDLWDICGEWTEEFGAHWRQPAQEKSSAEDILEVRNTPETIENIEESFGESQNDWW